jgi:protein dithiol oxidoreductase (disulfide-forming)
MKSMFRACAIAALGVFSSVAGAANWVEGQHYFPIKPAQPVNVAKSQVEVVEVFSYGCPACFTFYPTADKIKAALPKNAVMRYVPASWNQAEAWPLFQRAYLTALALGIADKAHNQMFNAIWASNELSVVDRATNRPKKQLPTIEQVAAFYARVTGTDPAKFVATSKSFSIEAQMRNADSQIKAYRADQTPTLIVQGKYRLTAQSAGGPEQIVELVKYLVAKESI